jgi:hypothetical protein
MSLEELQKIMSKFDEQLDKHIERLQIEAHEKWQHWAFEIPYIEFKSHWLVAVIPPFAGAIARFRVKTQKMNPNQFVSVYLDCLGNLGACVGPYWEVYPYNDDTFRCPLQTTKELVDAIEKSIDFLENNSQT